MISLVLVICSSAGMTQSRRLPAEQNTFGLEGPELQHPATLSDEELAALASDELMRKELDQDPPIPKLTREGLEAAVIHLHGPAERDLVVIGYGSPLIGTNVGPFWIIRDLPSGPKVVLSTIALGITIRKATFGGFRNIEGFAATAVTGTTVDFHFKGKKYVEYKVRSGPLGQ